MLPWNRKKVLLTISSKQLHFAQNMLENHGILYDSKVLNESETEPSYCLYVHKKDDLTARLLLDQTPTASKQLIHF